MAYTSSQALDRQCPNLTHLHPRTLGIFVLAISQVRGKPALWDWLVTAMAITVPDFALKISWLITTTGRSPPCSWPRTGFKSAQTMSPLNIRAMRRHSILLRPAFVQSLGLIWSTP